jgi:hypothetical protein
VKNLLVKTESLENIRESLEAALGEAIIKGNSILNQKGEPSDDLVLQNDLIELYKRSEQHRKETELELNNLKSIVTNRKAFL